MTLVAYHLTGLGPIFQADISVLILNNTKSDNKAIVCGVLQAGLLGTTFSHKYKRYI